MNRIITTCFVVIIGCLPCALLLGQSAFIPQNLGATVNSQYDDINPVISPDGKYLYFVRVNHPENIYGAEDSEDIWFSELNPDGSWSVAKHLPSLNTARYNSILSINSKGEALISGIYNRKGTFWKKRGLSTALINREGDSKLTPLKVKRLSHLNKGSKSSGMMSDDGKIIILSFSRAYNSKRGNLFYGKLKKNGKYDRLHPLRELNTSFSEDAPFLMNNGKVLYFSSDRDEKGVHSIYKVVRTSDDWSDFNKPVKLSDTINGNGWVSFFKTNTKGSWAYFSSTKKSVGGADLYKVKLFEENPFIVVSGRLLHSQSKKPLLNKDIVLTHSNNDANVIAINPDSATYSVKLPLGKLYSLTARTEHYSPATVSVDASKLKEFTRLRQDILVGPQPFVVVKGRLFDMDKVMIPHQAHPKIMIDGVVSDSAVIDTLWGSYTLKLKFGASHNIAVDAKGFKPVMNTLDLRSIDEYKLIELDLFGEEDKIATITGKVLNKKTNTPISVAIPVVIRVEGMTDVRATLDSLASTYELKLPLASAYTISASAPGYYPLYEIIDLRSELKSVKVFRDLVIVPIEVGQSIRLNNIFFETGKATLKKESFPELDRVATFLKDNPDIKIEIAGHTDNVGKVASNLKLSQSRAVAVSTYIISKGIAKQNIVPKGYGSSKPVVPNTTTEGKAQNRRVEFTILDK